MISRMDTLQPFILRVIWQFNNFYIQICPNSTQKESMTSRNSVIFIFYNHLLVCLLLLKLYMTVSFSAEA